MKIAAVAEAFNMNYDAMMKLAAIYSREYRDQSVVIKIGGEVIDLADQTVLDNIINQALMLKMFGANVVFCHGGGKQIDQACKDKGLPIQKENGLRIVDKDVLKVSRSVGRELQQKIADRITELGYDSKIEGVTVDTGTIIKATKTNSKQYTGEINNMAEKSDFIHIDRLKSLLSPDTIPVFDWHCRNGTDAIGTHLTVNADFTAAAVAAALNAKRLLYFSTDPQRKAYGVHQKAEAGSDEKFGALISELTTDEARQLIKDGTAIEGMAQKLKAIISATEAGVDGGVICRPEDILPEILGEGSGTLIKREFV
jgi:acetylglutamate kinase